MWNIKHCHYCHYRVMYILYAYNLNVLTRAGQCVTIDRPRFLLFHFFIKTDGVSRFVRCSVGTAAAGAVQTPSSPCCCCVTSATRHRGVNRAAGRDLRERRKASSWRLQWRIPTITSSITSNIATTITGTTVYTIVVVTRTISSTSSKWTYRSSVTTSTASSSTTVSCVGIEAF